jgi:hypothetical protein
MFCISGFFLCVAPQDDIEVQPFLPCIFLPVRKTTEQKSPPPAQRHD